MTRIVVNMLIIYVQYFSLQKIKSFSILWLFNLYIKDYLTFSAMVPMRKTALYNKIDRIIYFSPTSVGFMNKCLKLYLCKEHLIFYHTLTLINFRQLKHESWYQFLQTQIERDLMSYSGCTFGTEHFMPTLLV